MAYDDVSLSYSRQKVIFGYSYLFLAQNETYNKDKLNLWDNSDLYEWLMKLCFWPVFESKYSCSKEIREKHLEQMCLLVRVEM